MNYLGNKHMKSWTQHSNRWTDDNNNYQNQLSAITFKNPNEITEENRHAIKQNNQEKLIEAVKNVTHNLNNGFENSMIDTLMN